MPGSGGLQGVLVLVLLPRQWLRWLILPWPALVEYHRSSLLSWYTVRDWDRLQEGEDTGGAFVPHGLQKLPVPLYRLHGQAPPAPFVALGDAGPGKKSTDISRHREIKMLQSTQGNESFRTTPLMWVIHSGEGHFFRT